jgi:hypothetical protein
VQQEQQQAGTQGVVEHVAASPTAAAAASVRVVSRSSSSSAMLRLQQALQQQQQTQAPLQVLQPQHLALGVLASVWRTQPSGVVCVEQLGLQLSPLTLSLEGKHLKQLADFGAQVAAAAAGASERPSSSLVAVAGRQHPASLGGSGRGDIGPSSNAVSLRTVQQNLSPVQPPSLPAAATAASRRLKLYFEEWYISAITLCISFAPGSWFDPSPAGLSSAWSSAGGGAAAATAAAEAAAVALAAAAAAAQTPAGTDMAGEAGSSNAAAAEAGRSGSTDGAATGGSSSRSASGDGDEGDSSRTALEQDIAAGAADVGAAAAAVAAASSSPLPVYLQMALALAHAEEGAWLTLAPFSSSHTMINTESLLQVRASSSVQLLATGLHGALHARQTNTMIWYRPSLPTTLKSVCVGICADICTCLLAWAYGHASRYSSRAALDTNSAINML